MLNRIEALASTQSCGTSPIAARRLLWLTSRTSVPLTHTAPSVASYMRNKRRDRVLLPEPDGPTSATVCPAGTSNETPLSTSTLPSYEKWTLRKATLAPSGPTTSSTGCSLSEISRFSSRSSMSCSVSTALLMTRRYCERRGER